MPPSYQIRYCLPTPPEFVLASFVLEQKAVVCRLSVQAIRIRSPRTCPSFVVFERSPWVLSRLMRMPKCTTTHAAVWSIRVLVMKMYQFCLYNSKLVHERRKRTQTQMVYYDCYCDEHVSPVNLPLEDCKIASPITYVVPVTDVQLQSQYVILVFQSQMCDCNHKCDPSHMLACCGWDGILSITYDVVTCQSSI